MRTEMTAATELRNMNIRFSGYIDYEALYFATIAFMRQENMHIYETIHKDKAAGGGIREREIKFKGLVKLDEYIYWEFLPFFKVWDGRDVTITENGKQKTVVYGRIQIILGGAIKHDHGGFFSGAGPFLERVGEMLFRLRKRDEDLYPVQPIYDKLQELQNEYKRILRMPTIQ